MYHVYFHPLNFFLTPIIWCLFSDNAVPYGDAERDNCELSDRDTRDMDVADPSYFDTTGNYDFYERSTSRSGEECLDGKPLNLYRSCFVHTERKRLERSSL